MKSSALGTSEQLFTGTFPPMEKVGFGGHKYKKKAAYLRSR